MQDGFLQESVHHDDISLFDMFIIIKKRLPAIIGISLVIMILVGIGSYFMKPVYSSDFMIRLPRVSNDPSQEPVISINETRKMIQELERLRKEKRYGDLAKYLNLDEQKLTMLNKLDSKVQTGEKISLEIYVDTYDPLAIKEFTTGIITYLNQNPYSLRRIALKRDSLMSLRNEIQSKINDMDGLKNIVISQIKKSRVQYLGFDPLSLDTDIINFRAKIKDLNVELELLRGFEVAVDPVISKKPISPKISVNVLFAGLASVLTGVLLVIFHAWWLRSSEQSLKK